MKRIEQRSEPQIFLLSFVKIHRCKKYAYLQSY